MKSVRNADRSERATEIASLMDNTDVFRCESGHFRLKKCTITRCCSDWSKLCDIQVFLSAKVLDLLGFEFAVLAQATRHLKRAYPDVIVLAHLHDVHVLAVPSQKKVEIMAQYASEVERDLKLNTQRPQIETTDVSPIQQLLLLLREVH